MADLGLKYIAAQKMYREDGDGNYITPVRHAENSLTFGTEPKDITGWIEKYGAYADTFSTDLDGYEQPLWFHTILMSICTFFRLFEGRFDMFTYQCYDNIFADNLLTQPEGIYAELDLFSWKGIAIGYAFFFIHSGLETLVETMVMNAFWYMFYLVMSGSYNYGSFTLEYTPCPTFEFLSLFSWQPWPCPSSSFDL